MDLRLKAIFENEEAEYDEVGMIEEQKLFESALEELVPVLEDYEQLSDVRANLNDVIAVVEEHGVEGTLIALHGEELRVIAPSLVVEEGEEIDKDKVLAELVIAQEGLFAKITAAAKKKIEKIKAGLKTAFRSNTKLAKNIVIATKDVRIDDLNADGNQKLAKMQVFGYPKSVCADFAKGIDKVTGLGKKVRTEIKAGNAPKALKAIVEIYKIANMDAKINADSSGLMSKMKPVVEREKKSLKGLGYDGKSIVAMSKTVGDVLQKAESDDMFKVFYEMEDDVIEGEVREETADQLYDAIYACFDVFKLSRALASQQLTMLQAINAAVAKTKDAS